MKKFLIGLMAGFLLAGLALVLAVFALARLGARPPTVSDGSVLVLKLEGPLVERAPTEIPLPFFESQTPLTVREVWDLLRKAAVDPRVKAVVLMPRSLGAGWGKLDEIRQSLAKFRQCGKPLVAYLRSPGTREYYLATAADRVVMAPEDLLDLKGLRAELMYFRKTLDKIGVQVEIEHAGKYKDYGDQYTRTSMSPETRAVLNSVLDQIYGQLVETVAGGRNKTPDQVRAMIDEGPFLAKQALAKGLVDALQYEDQVFEDLSKRVKVARVKKLACRDYVKIPASSLGLEGRHRIALITGEGDIVSSVAGGFGDEEAITPGGFVKLLHQVGEDVSIKGVIVRINSPGGDSFASDEIWREMNLLSKQKPLVISMSDMAASGGYYIAMTGSPIVAYRSTFTGSIGVVYGKVNLRGLYDKLGITKDSLTRGRFAGIDSDYQPLTPEARKKLREAIDDNYNTFVRRVAEGRKRKFDQIEPLAQGRVWLGSQAKERGLVDELGGLDRAIELVKERARISRQEKVRLIDYPARRSILDRLLARSGEALLDARLRSILKQVNAAAWMRGGMLRVMPYAIEVQ